MQDPIMLTAWPDILSWSAINRKDYEFIPNSFFEAVAYICPHSFTSMYTPAEKALIIGGLCDVLVNHSPKLQVTEAIELLDEKITKLDTALELAAEKYKVSTYDVIENNTAENKKKKETHKKQLYTCVRERLVDTTYEFQLGHVSDPRKGWFTYYYYPSSRGIIYARLVPLQAEDYKVTTM